MRRQVGSCASSAAISAGVDGTFALWMTEPFRAMTQICVSAIDTSSPAKYSIVGSPLPMTKPILSASAEEPRPLPDVEKVEKSSVTKTRQIAIRWNIAAQHHLRPVEDLARCPIDKLAGRPADFLNAALVGLVENRTSPKRSFSNTIGPIPVIAWYRRIHFSGDGRSHSTTGAERGRGVR